VTRFQKDSDDYHIDKTIFYIVFRQMLLSALSALISGDYLCQ